MFVVCNRLQRSTIPHAGHGAFAYEVIPAGAPVLRFSPKLDLRFTLAQVLDLPAEVRLAYGIYMYEDHEKPGTYIYSADNSRFINHSENPNIIPGKDDQGRDCEVAARTIMGGEEFTTNYFAFGATIEAIDWAEEALRYPNRVPRRHRHLLGRAKVARQQAA